VRLFFVCIVPSHRIHPSLQILFMFRNTSQCNDWRCLSEVEPGWHSISGKQHTSPSMLGTFPVNDVTPMSIDAGSRIQAAGALRVLQVSEGLDRDLKKGTLLRHRVHTCCVYVRAATLFFVIRSNSKVQSIEVLQSTNDRIHATIHYDRPEQPTTAEGYASLPPADRYSIRSCTY
jgi:hypothetical protein